MYSKMQVFTDRDNTINGDKKRFPARKLRFGEKLRGLLDNYDTFLIVTIDNVSTKHLDEIRKDYRGIARFLFGKNTLMRRIICDYVKETEKMELMSSLEFIKGNSGLCFINNCNNNENEIENIVQSLSSRKISCRAKVGMVSPCDVFIGRGCTGIEPKYTTFFQSMNISTRINNSQIDVKNETQLIYKDKKICESESQLLSMLNVKPFHFGIKVESIYHNGQAYALENNKGDVKENERFVAFAGGNGVSPHDGKDDKDDKEDGSDNNSSNDSNCDIFGMDDNSDTESDSDSESESDNPKNSSNDLNNNIFDNSESDSDSEAESESKD